MLHVRSASELVGLPAPWRYSRLQLCSADRGQDELGLEDAVVFWALEFLAGYSLCITVNVGEDMDGGHF